MAGLVTLAEMRAADRRFKLAIYGGLALYLAVPLVRRMASGCPPFGAKVLPAGQVAPGAVTACNALTAGELLLWPLGFLLK